MFFGGFDERSGKKEREKGEELIFLDDRTKKIIERRYGPERVLLKVLAAEFDLSISRISQIIKEGLKLIQTYSVEEKPDDTAFMELCIQVFPTCKEINFSTKLKFYF